MLLLLSCWSRHSICSIVSSKIVVAAAAVVVVVVVPNHLHDTTVYTYHFKFHHILFTPRWCDDVDPDYIF